MGKRCYSASHCPVWAGSISQKDDWFSHDLYVRNSAIVTPNLRSEKNIEGLAPIIGMVENWYVSAPAMMVGYNGMWLVQLWILQYACWCVLSAFFFAPLS